MLNTWIVLVPPLCILLAVFFTKRLNLSLWAGLLAAALVAGNGSLISSLKILINRLWAQATDLDNLYLYAFLIILGIIICLLEYSGAALAFAQKLTHHLRSGKAAQTSTLWLSTSLFIDDYLSCLTSGYVMRSLTDKFNIPRAKLAYLIHSLSGPLVIMAPISSWIALITSQLENAGISNAAHAKTKILADPFYVYLQSIPYIFYSILLIVSVWFIVRRSISYGPMHAQELIAKQTGNLFGGKAEIASKTAALLTNPGSAWGLVIPILVLISSFVLGILWGGGYWLLGGSYSFLEALQKNNQTSLMLLIASLITLAIAFAVYYRTNGDMSGKQLSKIIFEGYSVMKTSIVMVFLASTMGIMLREDLQTGAYLAQALYSILSIALLPLLFYIISIITALITGSAWGTIALLVPIAVQMTTSLLAVPLPTTIESAFILIPVLGALFSGAVCGNHISPLAETTIMSASAAGCYPLDHSITQFWYALPAIICAGISFGLIGFLPWSIALNFIVALGTGMVACGIIIVIANRLWKTI
ncbi:Na+/H+ antiporter NhaC family protein [soil metagenome]